MLQAVSSAVRDAEGDLEPSLGGLIPDQEV
jgi:hypothetical protein